MDERPDQIEVPLSPLSDLLSHAESTLQQKPAKLELQSGSTFVEANRFVGWSPLN